VVTSPASHPFFLERETPSDPTFLETILYYSTHDELNASINFMGTGDSQGTNSLATGAKNNKPLFTTRDEDVEFKKLLWTCVLYVVRNQENEEAHQCVKEKNFLLALLMYLDPNNSSVST